MTVQEFSPHAVLIVEHDELLKSLTVDLMENAGFVALQAGNADEALAILETRPDIALLLTSISMPGSMDGLKLVHAVRERWPAIKIIVASGQVRLMGHNLPADCGFFAKPYQSAAMISEIRSLIGAQSGTAT
jgi:CheY-like chemotaxis protein